MYSSVFSENGGEYIIEFINGPATDVGMLGVKTSKPFGLKVASYLRPVCGLGLVHNCLLMHVWLIFMTAPLPDLTDRVVPVGITSKRFLYKIILLSYKHRCVAFRPTGGGGVLARGMVRLTPSLDPMGKIHNDVMIY